MSANCYAFQPCDFTLNSGHLTYMVICVHCYIYVGVSHNILKNFYVYSLFCHSGTSRMSHNVWACPFIPVTNWFLQRRKKSLNQIIVRIVKWKIDLYSSKTKLLENIFSLQQLSLSLSHWNTILSNQLRPTIIFILFTHLSANFIFHQYTEHLIIIKCPNSTIHMVFHCFLIYAL